jgi:uncharacterized protein (TIGR02453 family)
MSQISKSTIKFLKELAQNNNRAWFQEHKQDYLDAKANFDTLIEEVFYELEGPYELDFTAPKECLHRIYRNLRFSKDKTPYKTSLSANISSAGKKGLVSGIYIHLDPTKGSFLAGGVWHPESPTLQAIRKEIDIKGDELKKILNQSSFKKYFGDLEGSKLKKSPKGYDIDHQHIDLLRHKDLTVSHSLKVSEVSSKDLTKEIIKAALLIKPFLNFLQRAQRHRPTQRK